MTDNTFGCNNQPLEWSPAVSLPSVMEDPRCKTVVYLSGKMANVPNNNFEQFNQAAKLWRENGWTLINPAENFGGKQTLERNVYLKQDYTNLIQSCNAIALLPGWETSVGARTELAIAQSLGYTVYEGSTPGCIKTVAVTHIINPPAVPQATAETLSNLGKCIEPVSKSTADARESICALADKIVTLDRQKSYGSPLEDFSRTAAVLTGLGFRCEHQQAGEPMKIDASHIPVIMMAVKLSRLVHNERCFHRDSLIDIAGYAKCADMVETARKPL